MIDGDTNGRLVTVFGGSGFVGRHVVRALARRDWRIRVAVRRPDLAQFLQPIGRVGQIQAVQANLRYPQSLAAAMRDSQAVVNLVGILTESGRQNFDAVQAFGARAVARAAEAQGITNFVQMSAIGADESSPSHYARSKAKGEQGVQQAIPQAVITRPSIIFGPEDSFFNRFAGLARLLPALPLFGGGETKFQPVFVGDVAEAVALALDGHAKPGAIYELGGPETKTFRELLQFICDETQRRRALVPIPFGAARVMARTTEIANALSLGLFPQDFLTTRDQVRLLEQDNVVSKAAAAAGLTLPGLGIQPTSIETIVPAYLVRFRRTGQFDNTKPA
jgi:uncharacterized protein YbjT (DUF2867 family)